MAVVGAGLLFLQSERTTYLEVLSLGLGMGRVSMELLARELRLAGEATLRGALR